MQILESTEFDLMNGMATISENKKKNPHLCEFENVDK
jgi:hypothetical protein